MTATRADRRPSGNARAWIAVIALSLIATSWAVAVLVPLDYLALAPGATFDVAKQISVAPEHDHPAKATVLALTVRIRRRLSLVEALIGWRDQSVDVFHPRELFGTETHTESIARGRIEIADAKTVASVVALRRLGLPPRPHGLRVTGVLSEAPAAATLKKNDLIVAVDGHSLCIGNDLTATLEGKHPGDVVPVVLNDGRTVSLALTAAEGHILLGVGVEAVDCSPPFRLDIETGAVLGPSGGLAMTLALLDRMSPGELLGRGPVAVTGTIDVAGRVGPIGGIRQKTIAARRAGAKLFLVPTDEYALARHLAGPLRVIAVHSLDDALRALQSAGGDPLPPVNPLTSAEGPVR